MTTIVESVNKHNNGAVYVAALACRHVDYYKLPTEEEASDKLKLYQAVNSLLTAPLWGCWVAVSWNWFIAPLVGLGAITWPQGLGIWLFYGALSYKLGTRHISEEEMKHRIVEDWFAPIFGTLLFWLVAHFVTGTV